MSVSWEIDIYFTRENRDAEDDDALVEDHWHGRPVYRKTVQADSFEHGSSGTLALYYEDEENGLMKRSTSIKDPDMIAVDAIRMGEPDRPDPEEIAEDADEWEQGKQ